MANYTDLNKEELVEAVKARRAQGRTVKVDLRANEDALRAALDADDMENGDLPQVEPDTEEKPDPKKEAQPPAKATTLPASLRNQVSRQADPVTKPTQPTDQEFSKGILARNKADGLLYQVVKTAPDDFNKAVKARVPAQESGHPGFFWEGTEEEYAALFEKH